MSKVKVSDLQLADVIRLDNDTFSFATVYRINADGSRQLWRPYVETSDFSYTGGVIPYIGIEDFAISRASSVDGPDVELVRRGGPLK